MSKTISGAYMNGYFLVPNGFGGSDPFSLSVTGSIDIGAFPLAAALYAQGPSAWTVTNQGKITGGSKAGVELAKGGTITNQSGGTISGNYGVILAGSTGSVSNTGLISGNGQAGVLLNTGGYVYNQGTISGASGVTIQQNTGTVVNAGFSSARVFGACMSEKSNAENFGASRAARLSQIASERAHHPGAVREHEFAVAGELL